MEDRNNTKLVLGLGINDDKFKFLSSIENAKIQANTELNEIEKNILDNEEIIEKLTPKCDKVDYILATCSGAICGIIDIFLVTKPGQSQFQNITDVWFQDRTRDFAKVCGWNEENGTLESAIRFLEKKFKIPYDQTGAGGIGAWIFELNPKNHHFKSLAHNPSLVGLFFSILNQFNNSSSFISNGELITLEKADDKFELQGKDITSKMFCGFINWFGHIISDISGSSGSSTRGMGIPSPLWTWTNDIIAIKRSLKIPTADFDKNISELALKIYKEGYDARFQTAQAIPVIINELIVRFFYSTRRLIQYFKNNDLKEFSFFELWKNCNPFVNATVKRMLTIAHSTFCLIDTSEAIANGFIHSGGYFNVSEFIMRLNIPEIGRLSISLYGELDRTIRKNVSIEELKYLKMKECIVDVKSYELAIVELKERVSRIVDENGKLNEAIERIKTFGIDYTQMNESEQYELGTYVNLMLASTQLLVNSIKGLLPKYNEKDFDEFSKKKDKISTKNKNVIISFANFLYKIELEENDKKLLHKKLRKNA